jgi:2'-5' RNA ligase
MSRVVVVVPLSPLRDGDRFRVEDWPLHITVVPPFATEASTGELAAAIAAVTAEHPPLTTHAGEERLFGRHNTVPVNLVDQHPDLTRLHVSLVAALRPLATNPDERALTSSEFVPHVTIKRNRRASAGEPLELRQVALVDMVARADPQGRSVLATSMLLGTAVVSPNQTC